MNLSTQGRREMRRLHRLLSNGDRLLVLARLKELGAEPKKSTSIRKLRDPKYLAWIRGQKCYVGTGGHCYGPTEAHHTESFARGVKGDDRKTLPLCRGLHHKQWHTIGKTSFCERHHLDLDKEFARLHARYTHETGRKV